LGLLVIRNEVEAEETQEAVAEAEAVVQCNHGNVAVD
jgi:hypothetical protein